MWTDFILASIHHVLVFSLFAILTMEIVYARPGIDAPTIKRVAAVDAFYGITSTLVLIVGILRAIYGMKGWDYYADNILFWVKMAMFLGVGALSIPPTLAFLKWNRRIKSNPSDLPTVAEVKSMRKFLHMETTVLILIPVVAAALARGLTD
jgi:putative membrane protein